MVEGHPKFEAPPVVETVLGLQFVPLPGHTSAHAGWFWKEYLDKLSDAPGKEWPQVLEVPSLEDQFERFGAEDIWAAPGVKVNVGIRSPRIQFVRSDSERMIQLQGSRFILNWRKQKSAYPSYDSLLPEFRSMLHAFEAFTTEAYGRLPSYNQWEISYVDQIKRGDMWQSVRDWDKIFPPFSVPLENAGTSLGTGDETMSADWRFPLAKQQGRLYISLRLAKIPPSSEQVLHLTLTARGPVDDSRTWERGFDVGHRAISEAFLSITSEEAQAHWKRRG